jgi:menaquinone-dependent protoporphyrinogen oxidase
VKTLIVYSTRHGTTARCARLLAQAIPGGADLADLRTTPAPDLTGYDTLLVGGSVYGGRIRPAVKRFCERSADALLDRRVGLFICCLYTGLRAEAQLGEAFPPWLTVRAFARRSLGGAVRLADLGLVERFVFERVARVHEDVDRIDAAAIADLAAAAAGS